MFIPDPDLYPTFFQMRIRIRPKHPESASLHNFCDQKIEEGSSRVHFCVAIFPTAGNDNCWWPEDVLAGGPVPVPVVGKPLAGPEAGLHPGQGARDRWRRQVEAQRHILALRHGTHYTEYCISGL